MFHVKHELGRLRGMAKAPGTLSLGPSPCIPPSESERKQVRSVPVRQSDQARTQRSTSPRMNFSTFSRASSSKNWTGGDFMK